MATKLTDLLACCICTNEYRDPRMLTCIHTFCLTCLETLWSEKQPGEVVPCPVCRTAYKIPDEGVKGIQKNFFIQNFIDVKLSPEANSEERLPCDACSEESTDAAAAAADKFCIECNQKLCVSCSKSHRRITTTRNHQLVDMDNTEVISRLSSDLTKSFCTLHINKPIEMYCKDCKSANCLVCHLTSHQGHDSSDIEGIGEIFRMQLKGMIENISHSLNICRENLKQFDTLNRSILDAATTLQNEVLLEAANLKELVDQHAEKLLIEVFEMKINRQKLLETKKEELDRHLMMLESFGNYAKEVTTNSSAACLCQSFQDLKIRSNELLRSYSVTSEDLNFWFRNPISFSFVPSDFIKLISYGETENLIGYIDSDLLGIPEEVHPRSSELVAVSSLPDEPVRENISNVVHSDPIKEEKNFLRTLSLKKKNPTPKRNIQPMETFTINNESLGVAGVTWLENKIYVICCESSKVHVYSDSEPYDEELIQVEGMRNPIDMTCCLANRSIFICESPCFWRIQNTNTEISRWETGGESSGMSTTPSDELIVVVRTQQDRWCLDVYNSKEVKQSRSILLPAEVYHVCHAIQTPKNNFVLSYTNKKLPGVSQISELSADGKNFLRTFEYRPVRSLPVTVKEWWFEHLSIDEFGKIFVADFTGSRVFLLNSKLTCKQILLNKEQNQITWPNRLCYVRQKQQLIVGQGLTSTATLSLFNFSS